MSERLELPPSTEVEAEVQRRQTAVGSMATSSELSMEWWDQYVMDMPQSD